MPFNNTPQTSFIPKKPTVAFGNNGRASNRVGSGINFFLLIAIIIFAASVISAVFTYGWRTSIQRANATKQQNITKNNDAFDVALLQSMTELDGHIEIAKSVLAKHVSMPKIFNIIQRVTLESVRFSSFSCALNEKGDVSISMSGMGKTFNSLALQSDAFSRATAEINNPIISGISPQENGSIGFSFTGVIPIDKVLFIEPVISSTTPANLNSK